MSDRPGTVAPAEGAREVKGCTLCPRNCHGDRARASGYCRTGALCGTASICVHRGEEPVLGGGRGICNLFFARCNMQCVFCQNYQISRTREPAIEIPLSEEEAAGSIADILDTGVRQVGFVSPSHCIPQMVRIIRLLETRRPRPIFVMNTNGYDKVETIRSLEGTIDIYLPDLKYMDEGLARRLSDAPDYPRVAGAALREMYRQKGAALPLDGDGGASSAS